MMVKYRGVKKLKIKNKNFNFLTKKLQFKYQSYETFILIVLHVYLRPKKSFKISVHATSTIFYYRSCYTFKLNVHSI